jgi:hypothetical protein
MTVAEMHLAVRLFLDKTSSFEYASFLQEELDFWLNEAQERFVKQRLYGNNYKQEKFDGSQKRIDDLRSLVRQSTAISLTASSLGTNVKEATLPVTDATNPYMFYLNSTLYNVSSSALQTGDIIPISLLSRYLKDSVNNPYIFRPLVLFYNSTVDKIAFVYGDEFIPTTCDILYIKKPKKLVYGTPGTYETNTSELPEHTHKEIITICTELLVENIESPRVQTFSQINASKAE